MTLRDDGFNYLKHERASRVMELEFGHEHVPGKHVKRDRELQPEFPRSDVTHAERQQAERAPLTIEERRYSTSDNGQAFKAAVEEADYVLGPGRRGNFILLDGGPVAAEPKLHFSSRRP